MIYNTFLITAEVEKFYPEEKNLDKECQYWNWFNGCRYPKAEINRRRDCEGIIDPACLYFKDGRPDSSLSPEQLIIFKITPPGTTS